MENITHPSAAIPSTGTTRQHCSRSKSGLLIAAIAVGFLIWWPIGLIMLAYAVWENKFQSHRQSPGMSFSRLTGASPIRKRSNRRAGNSALAAYVEREQTRLRDEQRKLDELVTAFNEYKASEQRDSDERDFETFLQQHRHNAVDAESADAKPAD